MLHKRKKDNNMFQKITVVGGGMLGSQVAFQSAYKGKDVTLYDTMEAGLEKAKSLMLKWQEDYQTDMGVAAADVAEVPSRIHFTTDIKEAFDEADLVIEAISENVKIKESFYTGFADFKKANPDDGHTVIVSNSSTLLPSQFAEFTGRPEKFLNLHFAHQIWVHNIAEVMPHPGTDKAVEEEVIAFAKEIAMVPIILNKEQPAYVENTLQIALLDAGLHLWVNDIADYETIDKTWMIATGAPVGPFGLIDDVGLPIAKVIMGNNADTNPDAEKIVARLGAMIDEGKLGRSVNNGFYTYPNPAYEAPEFVQP